jgi:hypothetical protein
MTIDARKHLSHLVGKEIPTMTGRPNRVLRLHGSDVIVGTAKSPEGQPVPIEWVQTAMDRLLAERELEINPQSVGYRSAFVGAVLLTLPGVEGVTSPRRVRLVDEPSAPRRAIQSRSTVVRSTPAQADVEQAVDALQLNPRRAKLGNFESLRDISRPGLYSWWVDASGAEQVSRGLGATLGPGLTYVGQAGATQWPSGTRRDTTLRTRIAEMHLGKKISFSTLRFTLAACLRQELGLQVAGAKMLTVASEDRLTAWMMIHLEVAAFGYDHVDALDELEQKVLDTIDPPMNLKHRPTSEVRERLRALRSALATGS